MDEKDKNKYTNYQPDTSWESYNFAIHVYSLLFKEDNRLFLTQNVKDLSWER